MMKAFFNVLRSIYSHPYNKKRPFFALFRFFSWQLHKRLSKKKEFTFEFWSTRKIICYRDSQQTMYLVYNYIMDWEEFNFIRRFLKPDDYAFDVGSNIGVYTLWISQFINNSGKIIAFEPDPINFQRASRQVLLNKLGYVKVEQIALADRNGKAAFTQGDDCENHLILNNTLVPNSIFVNVMTLDEYCIRDNIKRIHFLKLDVEGAEFFVLQGAKNMLFNKLIDVIQFENLERLLEKNGS